MFTIFHIVSHYRITIVIIIIWKYQKKPPINQHNILERFSNKEIKKDGYLINLLIFFLNRHLILRNYHLLKWAQIKLMQIFANWNHISKRENEAKTGAHYESHAVTGAKSIQLSDSKLCVWYKLNDWIICKVDEHTNWNKRTKKKRRAICYTLWVAESN